MSVSPAAAQVSRSMPARVDTPERLAQAFALTLGRLHCAQGGDQASRRSIERAAREAWLASSRGDACVTLSYRSIGVDGSNEDTDGTLIDHLRASPVVAQPQPDQITAARPLVLEGDRLYLHRLWCAETRLAESIAPLIRHAPVADETSIDAVLADVFAGSEDLHQRQAVRTALQQQLTVITGGPGTGKTRTLASLLLAYSQLAPDADIALAAPTGKAAARLLQALSDQWRSHTGRSAVQTRLPRTALTLHRLLGLGYSSATPKPLRTLPYQLIIVDEASMLDLELAQQLLAALHRDARLVLAGDADQLAPVQVGEVLGPLADSLPSACVRLMRNHRQQEAPALTALAEAVRVGDVEGVRRCLERDDRTVSVYRIDTDSADANEIASQALRYWEPALATLELMLQDSSARPSATDAAISTVLGEFDRYRILAALHDGPLGTEALNRSVAALVRQRLAAPGSAVWYHGRLVMVVRNQPALELFNGDVGVCLAERSGGFSLAFAVGGQVRRIPVQQVAACDDAYAMTVHKSQGSEFERVWLVAPPAEHPLWTRELLYTGITRARRIVHLQAGWEEIAQALARRVEREGLLATRIQHAASRLVKV